MSGRKGLTLPSTPFCAGNSETMSSSTVPLCKQVHEMTVAPEDSSLGLR